MFANLLKARARRPVSVAKATKILLKAQERCTSTAARVSQCQEKLGYALIDSHAGGSGLRVARAQKALSAARAEDSAAALSLAAAEAIYAQAMAADATVQRQARVSRLESFLGARVVVAEDLARALTETDRLWKLLQQHSVDAENVGIPLPRGGLCGQSEQRKAMEQEVYRIGADPLNPARSFPGGKPHDMLMIGQPQALTTLADKLRQANDCIMAEISGTTKGEDDA